MCLLDTFFTDKSKESNPTKKRAVKIKIKKKCECGNWHRQRFDKCYICRKRAVIKKKCECGHVYYHPRFDKCYICRKKENSKRVCLKCGKLEYTGKHSNKICIDCETSLEKEVKSFCYKCKSIFSLNDLPEYFRKNPVSKYKCINCFKKYLNEINYGPVKYKRLKKIEFAEEIRKDPNNKNLGQVVCAYNKCGKWFNPKLYEFNNRKRAIFGTSDCFEAGNENLFYCSDDCKSKCEKYGLRLFLPRICKECGVSYEPKAHHQKICSFCRTNRKGTYDREVQPELRELVLERDKNTCFRCNKVYPKCELDCHHVEGILWEPLESADIDKCKTVCISCHIDIHKQPGCGYRELTCQN